jgi:hypothetical protein
LEENDVLFESLVAFSLFEPVESLDDNSEHDDADEVAPLGLATMSVNPESVRKLASSLSELSFVFDSSSTLQSNEIGDDEVDDKSSDEDKLDDDEFVDK